MGLKLLVTEDGSHTLHNDTLNEIYHSTQGAVQESMHVYIRSAYDTIRNNFEMLNILEIGFGTGLNAWLTLLECNKHKQQINYVTLEPFPISNTIYNQLNYPENNNSSGAKDIFLKLHESLWMKEIRMTEYFSLLKIRKGIEQYSSKKNNFHLIYFDAFAPDIQPGLWTKEIFIKLYDLMAQGGVLVTYSAKGVVRRNMQHAGFKVERIEGPPGKREMLRATKE